MANRFFNRSAILMSAALFCASGAFAQSDNAELTTEEIQELFQQQTRGLKIAPSSAAAATEEASDGAEATEVTYTEVAPEAQINIQIQFDFDSASLRNDQKERLGAMCNAMQSSDIGKFKIIGHTDASGSAAYNASLSELRAQEVKRFLTGDCGIAENRLEAIGVGEEFPLNDADPRADENRRVEFQVIG